VECENSSGSCTAHESKDSCRCHCTSSISLCYSTGMDMRREREREREVAQTSSVMHDDYFVSISLDLRKSVKRHR